MVGCRAVRSVLGVSLMIAALVGPAISTAQEPRAPTETPHKYDEWELFPPSWEKALRTIGEDTREATGNSKLLAAALVATEAQVLTLGLTEGMAYGTARARPNQSNDPGQWFSGWGKHDSFPSSHVSQTFAVAAVIDDRFGRGPGIVAYGLAGLVGAARLVQDKHWASDVAGGAVLGWAVGHFLSVRNAERHSYLDFFPFADVRTKTYGFVMQTKF